MSDKGRVIALTAGLIIFAFGLIGPLGPIGIGFGIGLIVSSQRRKQQATTKKRMTAKENNQLITTVLPITTNKK